VSPTRKKSQLRSKSEIGPLREARGEGEKGTTKFARTLNKKKRRKKSPCPAYLWGKKEQGSKIGMTSDPGGGNSRENRTEADISPAQWGEKKKGQETNDEAREEETANGEERASALAARALRSP